MQESAFLQGGGLQVRSLLGEGGERERKRKMASKGGPYQEK